MELASFDEIYLRGNGVEESDIAYLNERLSWDLPFELKHLYLQANGVGIQVNDIFAEFWSIDQIVSFNEIYEHIIERKYVFFASSSEGYDSYAYQKADRKIYVFPTDCGIEDLSDGEFCANNLDELIEYLKKK